MRKIMLLTAFSMLIVSITAYGEEYKALVIGITEYNNKEIDLKNASDDAEAVAEVLRERYKFTVTLLRDGKSNNEKIERNGEATYERIEYELNNLINNAKKDQTVLIYYSGHGEISKDHKKSYWIPADAKIGDYKTYLEHTYLIDKLSRIKSHRVLLISDSCFAGALFDNLSKELDKPNPNDFYRWAMTSGSIEKVDGAGPKNENNSYFTYALIKELIENKNPEITPEEIFPKIKKIVTTKTDQTPLYMPMRGNRLGQFVFSATAQNLPSSHCNDKPFENSVKMAFIYMKPGAFFMGTPSDTSKKSDEKCNCKSGETSEESHKKFQNDPGDHDEQYHWVRLTGFYIQTTEVTQKQWKSVTKNTPSYNGDCDDCPVENVSYCDIQDFIAKLNEKEGIKKEEIDKIGYDLPTEAQWEYVCRAGTKTPFSTGYTITTDDANYNGKFPYFNGPIGDNRQKTVEVRELPPNQWGIYGMHGNVWEWCKDVYDENAYLNHKRKEPINVPAINNSSGKCYDLKIKRVIRGGAWTTDARSCRCAHRAWAYQNDKSSNIGFRLIKNHQ